MEINSINTDDTAIPKRSFRRIFGKICQLIARKTPFLPARLRVLFQSWNGVNFVDMKTVFLGEDVYFDDIYPENITIGKNVRITAGTKILSHFFDTRFEPSPNRPFRFYQGNVVICDNVFIGVNSVIAKPIVIGKGAVIGANSLVVSDVPENTVFVGVPAKQVGIRPPMKLIKE